MIQAAEHVLHASLASYAIARDRDAPRFAPVRAHLAEGCRACAAYVERIRELATFGTAGAPTWYIPKRIVLASGMRGAALADIQLVCGAGPYEVDLLVREHEAMPQLEIVGQITQAGHIYDPVPELRLALIDSVEERPVVETVTDAFGEFDLGWKRDGAYGLRLGEDANAPCVLVWDRGEPE